MPAPVPPSIPPLVGFLALLAAGLAAGYALLAWWTLYRLRHPPRRTYATALAQNRPGQPDQIPAANGAARTFDCWSIPWRGMTLPVWDFAGDAPTTTPATLTPYTPQGSHPPPIFILTHGWGDSRIGALTRAQALMPIASRFIAWDLPGHGDAPGACMLGVHEHDALRALIERVAESHAGAPIVLLGWSLGAGVSIAAMSNWDSQAARRVSVIIAEAPYRLPQTPARNMMRSFGLPTALNLPVALAAARALIGAPPYWHTVNGTFDRAALARALPCPLLVIHGEDDPISPIEDGRAIALAAPHGAMMPLPGAGHHSLWTGDETREAVVSRARSFVESLHATNTL